MKQGVKVCGDERIIAVMPVDTVCVNFATELSKGNIKEQNINKKTIWSIITIAYVLCIWWLSSQDAVESGQESLFIVAWLLYACRWKNILGYMLFGLLLVPVIDEFIQLFSAGRAGMIQDILLDFSGAVTGLVVVKALRKYPTKI